jgi:hypothetical protein
MSTSDVVKTSKMQPIEGESISSYIEQHHYHNCSEHLMCMKESGCPLICSDDIADTLKENASASFDEEYDVVDEDEQLLPSTIGRASDIVAGRNRPQ